MASSNDIVQAIDMLIKARIQQSLYESLYEGFGSTQKATAQGELAIQAKQLLREYLEPTPSKSTNKGESK